MIETVAIVGAGFMGTGIAESVARARMHVILVEPSVDVLEHSRNALEASTRTAVDRGKLTASDRARLLERVAWTTDDSALSDTDLLLEAVVEDAAVKAEVFAQLDAVAGPGAIIASNTSSISITELAAVTRRPESVVGLHFFSPVPQMPLVEIVAGLRTAPETLSVAERFVEQLGKRPLRTKDRSGFVVNMLLVPYLTAAVRMFEEGFASREDIDDSMHLGCGHPMGPLRLCDLIGLDVLYAICASLYEEFKRVEYAPPPLLKRIVACGWLGRKSGRGFYAYEATA